MSNSTKTNVPVESMLDDFWNSDGLSPQSREMQPAVNVGDLSDKYELKISIPGVKKKDFKIRVEHGLMSHQWRKQVKRKQK